MKRVLCVWLPNWPLQRWLATQPELERLPVVLYAASRRGGFQVVTGSSDAAAQGVRPGMPLAEARALLQKGAVAPRFQLHDPQADRQALRSLAGWCQQFSPLAGTADSEPLDGLLVDTTGCTHLFGGEQRLAEHVLQAFHGRGFSVRIAVADTIGAAWAVAHFREQEPAVANQRSKVRGRPRCFLIPSGRQTQALGSLPVEALRLAQPAVRTLHELGIHCVGQLLALPRASLPSRLGVEVLRRLDQALGLAAELLIPERPPEPIAAQQSLEHPTADRRTLEAVLKQLLEQIGRQVQRRQAGVQQLWCCLEGANQAPVRFSVGLVRPSSSVRHLWELVQTQLERLQLPGEVSDVRLQADVTPFSGTFQQQLFDDAVDRVDRDGEKQLAVLVDRLSSRLGDASVLRPRLVADAQPEYASRYEPLIGPTKRGHPTKRGQVPFSGSMVERQGKAFLPEKGTCPLFVGRPLRLKSPPVGVEVMSIVPDGPPLRFFWNNRQHVVTRSWGPERIETGWWRSRHIRRDYYRVETTHGQRFWLFRQIDAGTWFLHGVFE